MANEIQATYDSGKTLYVLVFNEAGQVWRLTTGTFVAYEAANIDDYDIALSEIATNTGQYRGTFDPDIPAGVYAVVLFEQAGIGPVAADDQRIGDTGIMHWDGSAEIDQSVIDTVVDAILADTDLIDDQINGLAAIKAEVEGLGGAAMRGTDNAATVAALSAHDTKLDTVGGVAVAIQAKTDELPDEPADQSQVEAAISEAESNVRGADSDDLKTLSGAQDTILGHVQRIGTASVTVVAPVSSDGYLTIVQGDDYLDADGRALKWQVDQWTTPDLAGATGKLRFVKLINYQAGNNTADLEVDVCVSMSESTAVFKADLTAAQTDVLGSSPPADKFNYVYQIQITTAGGKKLSPLLGRAYVKQKTKFP